MTRPAQPREPMTVTRGGELAFLILAAIATLLVGAAALGVGLAAAVVGHGFIWPHGSRQWVNLTADIARGRPAAALDPVDAHRLPGTAAIYTGVAVCEAVTIATALILAAWVSRWWRGPADPRRGMATRWQASDALGRRQLRRNARVIRPDLDHHGKER